MSAEAVGPSRSGAREHRTDRTEPASAEPASGPDPGLGADPDLDADLERYRAAIGRLHADLSEPGSGSITADLIDGLVRPSLEQPDAMAVLASGPAGVDGVIASLRDEVGRYRPGSPSSANDAAALVRIFLLSQIDAFWWRDIEPFHDADLATSRELRDLTQLAETDQLRFRFKRQPRGLPGRARNRVVHRYLQRYEPHTSGLSQAMARPELVSLLNRLAADFADDAPTGTPPLWVTSILRTVEQQHRLRQLGYSALFPSAHCVGFAVDVEMRWYARFGADGALAANLLDYQARGLVNVVDEGQAWHVCLSPTGLAELRSP